MKKLFTIFAVSALAEVDWNSMGKEEQVAKKKEMAAAEKAKKDAAMAEKMAAMSPEDQAKWQAKIDEKDAKVAAEKAKYAAMSAEEQAAYNAKAKAKHAAMEKKKDYSKGKKPPHSGKKPSMGKGKKPSPYAGIDWKSMTEEEAAAKKKAIHEQEKAKKDAALAEKMAQLSPEDQAKWQEKIDAEAAKQAAEKAKWAAMTPEEQAEWKKKMAKKPPHYGKDKKGPSPYDGIDWSSMTDEEATAKKKEIHAAEKAKKDAAMAEKMAAMSPEDQAKWQAKIDEKDAKVAAEKAKYAAMSAAEQAAYNAKAKAQHAAMEKKKDYGKGKKPPHGGKKPSAFDGIDWKSMTEEEQIAKKKEIVAAEKLKEKEHLAAKMAALSEEDRAAWQAKIDAADAKAQAEKDRYNSLTPEQQALYKQRLTAMEKEKHKGGKPPPKKDLGEEMKKAMAEREKYAKMSADEQRAYREKLEAKRQADLDAKLAAMSPEERQKYEERIALGQKMREEAEAAARAEREKYMAMSEEEKAAYKKERMQKGAELAKAAVGKAKEYLSKNDRAKKLAQELAKKAKDLMAGKRQPKPNPPKKNKVKKPAKIVKMRVKNLKEKVVDDLSKDQKMCDRLMRASMKKASKKDMNVNTINCAKATTPLGRRMQEEHAELRRLPELEVKYTMATDEPTPKEQLTEGMDANAFVSTLQQEAKSAGMDVGSATVGAVAAGVEEVEITYEFNVLDWTTSTNDWLQSCGCGENRSATVVCNQYQGETLIGTADESNCIGAKPAMQQTCPCPDSKGIAYKFSTTPFNTPFAAWAQVCQCGEVREAINSCDKYQNDEIIEKNVADSSLCFFSMEMMGQAEDDLIQTCPKVCNETVDAAHGHDAQVLADPVPVSKTGVLATVFAGAIALAAYIF